VIFVEISKDTKKFNAKGCVALQGTYQNQQNISQYKIIFYRLSIYFYLKRRVINATMYVK